MKSTAYANANIALIKYWGKSSDQLNIPAASSLSMTLSDLGTIVTIESIDGPTHQALIEDEPLAEKALSRLTDYLLLVGQHFSPPGFLRIRSKSQLPYGAGLASSAAFFAALATALDAHFSWDLDQNELSILARMGSASAARSIPGGFSGLYGGVSHQAAHAFPIASKMDVAMVIAVVDQGIKPLSSREAMTITKETSPFFESFIAGQNVDFERAMMALKEGDFLALGRLMEFSTLKMFATMWTARPAINYWRPESLQLIDLVYRLRKMHGDVAFFTMDAGPNVKILCPSEHLPLVLKEVASSRLTVDIRSSLVGDGARTIEAL